jgi:putative ABC transport system permease protein
MQVAERFRRDLERAVRSLKSSPGYTCIAVLMLALGIGANLALFDVVYSSLLAPLPFREPDRLVMVTEDLEKFGAFHAPVSTIEFEILQRTAKSFEDVGAYESVTGEMSGVDVPETLQVAKTTSGVLRTLGVPAMLGRTFAPGEDAEGSSAAVISYSLWQRRFGGDANIIGRTLTIDRQVRTIIGVMPESFVFPLRGPAYNNEPADVYLPMAFTATERQGRGPILQKSMVARLRDGVTVAQAKADLESVRRAVIDATPGSYLGEARESIRFDATPLQQEVTSNVRGSLWSLMAAVGILLLIASANVANLSLARFARRRREFAIRVALGASRANLVRMVLSESLMLSVAGGVCGIALALSLSKLYRSFSFLETTAQQSMMSPAMAAFACSLVAVTAVLCGLFAAIQFSRAQAGEALKESTRSSPSRAYSRLTGLLVGGQFGMTLVLLLAGGLMLRSLLNTIAALPGFDVERSVAVTSHLPSSYYAKAESIRSVLLKIAQNASQKPGVKWAGIGTELPLGNWEKGTIVPEGTAGSLGPLASQVWVTGHYLEALGVQVKSGRLFDEFEYAQNRGVVVISETLAKTLWPNEPAVGKKLRNSRIDWLTVIGVVSDVKEVALNAPPISQIYEPHVQLPDRILEITTIPFMRNVNLVASSTRDNSTVMREMAQAIQEADASLAISQSQPLKQIARSSTRFQRFGTFLVVAFAGTALLLAIAGVTSVLGYAVIQRRSEIAIRMALGATPDAVIWLFVKRGMALALGGIVAGGVVALAMSKLFSSWLYGVSARDPLSFIVSAVILTLAAAIACYVPARRASLTQPNVVLRAE